MRAIALIALVALTSACATVPVKPAPDYWIFSWVMRDGTYRFALIRETERAAFVNGFRPSFPGNGGIAQIETQLRTLPKGALVGWGDATCSHLIYPPKEMMRSLELFANANRIKLVILPGKCEGN